MTGQTLTSYAELAEVVAAIPMLLREVRRQRGLSLRAAAKQIGISSTVLFQIESGRGYHSRELNPILQWLDQTSGAKP